MPDKCIGCGSKAHEFSDCPLRNEIKELVIARLERMPSNLRVSIG